MEVEIQDHRLLVESRVKMKNLVLVVEGAEIQEKVTGMVIEETTNLGNQMVTAKETEKLVMVKVAVDHPFLVMEVVGLHSSEVMEEEEHRSSEEMEVAAQVGKEAIQKIAAADLAFDFDLEDFADIADELADVLALNQ